MLVTRVMTNTHVDFVFCFGLKGMLYIHSAWIIIMQGGILNIFFQFQTTLIFITTIHFVFDHLEVIINC